MQVTNSSVRATVISISGQANAIRQAGGGPVLGVIGNVLGIRAALAAGAVVIALALALYGRAIAHHVHEPELDELSAPDAVSSADVRGLEPALTMLRYEGPGSPFSGAPVSVTSSFSPRSRPR